MNIASKTKYRISSLDKFHQRKSFNCGIESLDHYIQKQASQDHRKNIAVTYILNDENLNKIAGFYTLSSTTIELKNLPQRLSKKLPRHTLLPATLIGRLAVDANYQKQGLGGFLLADALKRSFQTSQTIASYAVVVDAINDKAKRFYQKYAFIPFSPEGNRLYLPTDTIHQL